LRGGHVQTIASFLIPRQVELPPSERRLIEVDPGIHVLCHCHWQSERKNALTIIIVHGLEGSAESEYMLGVAKNGLAAGMNVIRVNQRNCGGTDDLAPTLYNSSLSADIAGVARNVVEQDGVSRFALVGFSMGGNLVLKLAGEWGSDGPAQFRAVVGVCPAMDLAASSDALHRHGNRLYEYYFLWQLFRSFRRKAKLFPGHFDPSRLRGVSSLRSFDDRITAYYCGFTGAADYYARAAAANVVDRIKVPALILHAANDPFIRLLPETRGKILANPSISFVEASDGGHCAFISRSDGVGGDDGHWAESELVNFLKGLDS
jgi:predicted alpha/beta-fold hydrolase